MAVTRSNICFIMRAQLYGSQEPQGGSLLGFAPLGMTEKETRGQLYGRQKS